MKWLIFAAVITLFDTVRNILGIHLGLIPALLYYGVVFYVANLAKSKWEKRDAKKRAEKAAEIPLEQVMQQIPKMYRLEIENRMEDSNGLSGYLAMCVKEKVITRDQAEVILIHAKK